MFTCKSGTGAVKCLDSWDTMILYKCKIIEKRGENQKERRGQAEGFKTVHSQEKCRTPGRISVFKGNTETISKLSKKKSTNIHHSDREGTRSLEEGQATANKLESPKKIKLNKAQPSMQLHIITKLSANTLKHLLIF